MAVGETLLVPRASAAQFPLACTSRHPAQVHAAPRHEAMSAVLASMCCDISLRAFQRSVNSGQKARAVNRRFAQLTDGNGAMSQRLIALTASSDQRWIATRNGFARRLPVFGLKRASPQHRL